MSDRTDPRAETRFARRLNIVGAWVVLCSCTTFRALADSQWRFWVVVVLLMLWATAGAVAWRSWRQGQLVREGPPAAFNQRVGMGTLSFRRRIVLATPGLMTAISFSMRKGASDQFTETVGPVCSSIGDRPEVCQTSTVVVQQTVTTDLGMSAWPQAMAWMLFGLTLCWWVYVVAAENLARRFGEQNLWRAALRMRREAVPQYWTSSSVGIGTDESPTSGASTNEDPGLPNPRRLTRSDR